MPRWRVGILLIGACVIAACAAKQSPARGITVRELDRFWLDSMISAGILGQDGGNVILFGDRALWSFGDTSLDHLSDFSGGPGMSNSALVLTLDDGQPSAQYLSDADGHARYVVPFEAPETWEGNRIWPGSGISIGESIYLYFEIVALAGAETGAPAGFGLSRASLDDDQVVFTRVTTGIPLVPHAVVQGEDGWIYLYGIRSDAWDSWATLYRVDATSIEDPLAYELVDDELIFGVYGQLSVAWNGYLGRYVMLHVGNPFDEPQHFYIRTAVQPRGPFSEPALLAHLPGETGPDWEGLFYCPYLHPELFRDQGRIMVITYCVVGQTIPRLIEVELL